MPPPIFNRRQVFREDEDERVGGQDAWVTIDRTVGRVDEEKVRDCMDDIDTLLVFAGLYSAVLTAFLIESYKTLMVDPTQALLQQLVSQSANYQLIGGFLNTTFVASQAPAFEVATSAIRVNVCWFASLIISLSTASYGILVKQWLREYLAVDRTAAHERLRIRHFRKQGLVTWRLFDIAAILPMFLQLSLTLFLVGICFFTAAVHESIGRTSFVLVCAWIFFLALAVLAPLISSRCPYKTTFLKAAFRHLRNYVPLLTRSSIEYVCLQIATVYHNPAPPAIIAVETLAPDDDEARDDDVSTPGNDPARNATSLALKYHDYRRAVRDTRFHLEYLPARLTENSLQDLTHQWKEEIESRNDEASNLIIFQNIDYIFLDDRILDMMREALQRRPPPSQSIFNFVVGILGHRSDPVLSNLNSQIAAPIAWPWALSVNARTTLVDILMDSLLAQVSIISTNDWHDEGRVPDDRKIWMNQVLGLVFALSAGNNNLPPSTSSALKGWLRYQDNLRWMCHLVACQLDIDSTKLPTRVWVIWSAHVLTLFLAVLRLLPTEDAAQSFMSTVQESQLDKLVNYFQDVGAPVAESRDPHVWERAQSGASFVTLTLLDVAAGVLNSLTIAQEDKLEGSERIPAFPKNVQKLLEFMFQLIPLIKTAVPDAELHDRLPISGVNLETFFWTLFTTTPHAVLDFWSARSTDLRAHLGPGKFLSSLLASCSLHDVEDTTEFLSACARYFESKLNSKTPLAVVSGIRLCHLVYGVPTVGGEEVLRAWHMMFDNVVKCITYVSSSDSSVQGGQEATMSPCGGGSHTDTCSAAFALLDELDKDGVNDVKEFYHYIDTYPAWVANFNTETSQLPDAMVKTLLQFVCQTHTRNKEGYVFWRARRFEHSTLIAPDLASALATLFSHPSADIRPDVAVGGLYLPDTQSEISAGSGSFGESLHRTSREALKGSQVVGASGSSAIAVVTSSQAHTQADELTQIALAALSSEQQALARTSDSSSYDSLNVPHAREPGAPAPAATLTTSAPVKSILHDGEPTARLSLHALVPTADIGATSRLEGPSSEGVVEAAADG